MKRAILYLCLGIFIALVVQPNLKMKLHSDTVRVPDVSNSQPTTNDEASIQKCESHAKIGIDAAHGGDDYGYMGTDQIPEKEINLALALNIGRKLEMYGYDVVYTRQSDRIESSDTEQNENAQRLAKLKAEKVDYILRISMSNDIDTFKKGYVIFTQPSEPISSLSKQIANELDLINFSICEGVDSDHYANFPILNDKDLPAISLQLGYLTNREDYSKLTDTSYQEKIGQAITNAFLKVIN